MNKNTILKKKRGGGEGVKIFSTSDVQVAELSAGLYNISLQNAHSSL